MLEGELKVSSFKFGVYCIEEMAQRVIALGVKPDDLSLIPGAHMTT